jgi:hypothetical protein
LMVGFKGVILHFFLKFLLKTATRSTVCPMISFSCSFYPSSGKQAMAMIAFFISK